MRRTILLSMTMVAILVAYAGAAQAQTTIDTIPQKTWDITAFGHPDTSTYGQVITAPVNDTKLDSFTFLMNVPNTVTFRGEVYAWDGAKATGPNLYESAPRTTSGSGHQEITFNTGSVDLVPSQRYILFATVSKDYASSVGSGGWGGTSSDDAYLGGEFRYMNNGSNYGQLFTQSWNSLSTSTDAAFRAVFSGLDTRAPTASISSPASGSTVSGTVPVSANASDNVGVSGMQFRLDGSNLGGEDTEAPYSASWDTTTVADGDHTLTAVARDEAGNTTTSEPISVTVDNTAPVATIDSGPTGTALSNSASFSFSSETGATLACKLDDEPDFVACSSSKEYTNLPNGPHTFSVRATDEAGNTGEVSRTWMVDTTLPNTTITSGPSGSVKSNSASFSFSSEGSDFRCSLDGGPYSECNPPRSYFNLANGTHTFKVKATDVPGNTTPATRTWTVDNVLPTVTGMYPRNASIITDVTPTIKATVRDNRTNLQKANVKLYVNGVLISPTKYSYSASTDVLTYNSPRVAKGKKTVRVVATDAAKNIHSTSWYFTIK